MNGRRSIVGLCMLCALLVSAFAAQSASAISGTTQVTCKEGPGNTGGATFKSAHCLPGEAAGKYAHYKVEEKTEVTLTAGSETTKLKSTIGGVAVTFTSSELEGTGTVENKVAANGEHYIKKFFHFILRSMFITPFVKCFVYTDEEGLVGAQGVVDTENLTATTEGQGDAVKFTPEAGEVMAKYWVLDKNKKTSGEGGECAIAGTYTTTGSVVATPEGATIPITHTKVTEQNTLKLGIGATFNKAGIEGSLTVEISKMGAKAFNPASFTTVTT